jgi:NAD(P)-dependent dehydrogenase (short-subunit alcohol dehydrogenase family)
MSWRRALRSRTGQENFPPELLHPRDEVPEDLVGTTFFLASPDADFVTGQMISVDGEKNMH